MPDRACLEFHTPYSHYSGHRIGIYNYVISPLPFSVNLRWRRKSADYTLDFLSCTQISRKRISFSKQTRRVGLERFLCFVFCVHRGSQDMSELALCVPPFWSLAPLPRHLRQQCKQLSSRTAELPSRSSSPSLWRG